MAGSISWQDASGADHILVADLIKDLSVENATLYPEDALEDGSQASDHAIHKPSLLKITLKQTQVPISEDDPLGTLAKETVPLKVRESQFKPGGALAVTAAIGSAIAFTGNALGFTSEAAAPSVIVLNTQTPTDRILAIWDQLEQVRLQARPATIEMLGNVYPGMHLTLAQMVRGTGQISGTFNLTFKHIRTVSTHRAALLPSPAEIRMKRAELIGSQPVKTAEQTEKDMKANTRKSILASFSDF